MTAEAEAEAVAVVTGSFFINHFRKEIGQEQEQD